MGDSKAEAVCNGIYGHPSKGSFTLDESERERKFVSLIFITAQCEHQIGYIMNTSESDVTSAFTPM